MGVIQRQAVKYTIINYLGVFLGGLFVIFLYPLNDKLYGLAQFLFGISFLFLPLAGFGVSNLAVKYFNQAQAQNRLNDFKGVLLSYTVFLNLVFAITIILFKTQFYQLLGYLGMSTELIKANEAIIFGMVLLLNLLNILNAYISNYQRIAVPSLIYSFGFKLFLPVVFTLVLINVITINQFKWGIFGYYVAALLAFLFYLNKLSDLKISFHLGWFKKERVEMMVYTFFTGLTYLGSSLVYRLDAVMISLLMNLESNGFYSRFVFIANALDILNVAIVRISGPILATAISTNNMRQVSFLYKKSSNVLFFGGGLAFIGIYFLLPHVFQFSKNPSAFEGGGFILLTLGLSKLFDMVTSLNTSIIEYTKIYKYNMYFILLLGIVNYFLNLQLIPLYGLNGAALASFIALFLYNVLKLVVVYKKFNMLPFSSKTLKISVVHGFAFLLLTFIDLTFSPILNILILSLLLFVFYGFTVFYFNLFREGKTWALKMISKVRS